MFSLFSSTLGIFRPSILKTQTWRLFSSSHVNDALPMDPERRKKLDQQNELKRFRWANEPQFRERITRQNKAWMDRVGRLPAYITKRNAGLRRKYNTDDEYREQIRKIQDEQRVRMQAEDARYRLRRNLHAWCLKYQWVRDELPWKTYVPVLFAEKVHRQCKGCTHVKAGGGVKLWWQATDGSWLCHACHLPKDDHTAAMPHGYEDVTSMKELVTRKKELARLAKAPTSRGK